MKFSSALVAIAGVLSASTALAAPTPNTDVVKRTDSSAPTDVQILNYALTLEMLEKSFYAQVVAKFDAAAFKKAGYQDSVRNHLVLLAAQEAQHVAFLSGALAANGVTGCQFNFGLSSPKNALATARLLEQVGVSAYLGAAGDISSKEYLAAAASITTVEARHASYLNEQTGHVGFPVTYDSSLTYAQVYTLAAPFIVADTCKGGSLPASIQAFPALTINTKTARAGHRASISFKSESGKKYYGVFISGGQQTIAPVTDSTIVVPKTAGPGITFLVITTASNATELTNSNTVAGPGVVYLD